MDDLQQWARLLTAAAAEREAQPRRICALCVELLDVSGAGITMVSSSGHRGVVCATDDRASRIEDLQLTSGVGPCMDAISSGSPVLLNDLADSTGVDMDRWTGFTDEVRSSGVGALFAFPLRIGAITVGALDLYRESPGDLANQDLSAALLAADAAAIALLYLNTDREDLFDTNPETGADYRLQDHQATGMVAMQLGVSLEEAMLRLRARAFGDGRSLSEIADDVVARRLRFTSEDL